MSIEQLINQEEQARIKEIQEYDQKITGPDTTFRSRPVPPNPDIVSRIIEQETSDREARANMTGTSPESVIDTPASLYHEIHGETMLKSVMGLPTDNAHTQEINNYILQKMRVGKMQDTKGNFERVLTRLLAKNNLSLNQQKPYLISRLHLYLNRPDEEDELIQSIIKRGGKRVR